MTFLVYYFYCDVCDKCEGHIGLCGWGKWDAENLCTTTSFYYLNSVVDGSGMRFYLANCAVYETLF